MTTITGVRTWLNTSGALQIQSTYQIPIDVFSQGLWFEKISFHENPIKSEYQGLNANNFENILGRVIKRNEPYIRILGRVTPNFLLNVLPAASGANFSGDTLGWAVVPKYLSIVFKDNDSAISEFQVWRFSDCQIIRLILTSESFGELMYELFLVPEIFKKEAIIGSTIIVPNTPTDFERFNHRAGQPLVKEPSGSTVNLATGKVIFEIINKVKPHFGPALFPTQIKAGYTRTRGEVRGRYGNEYKDVRDDALAVIYKNFVQKWITASGTKFLQLDLQKVDMDSSPIEAGENQISPFLGEYETFSNLENDPVIITKGGF